MRPATLILVLCTALLSSCSITPRHDIMPRPEHIRAGVTGGDTVEIETRDGRKRTVTVVDVTATAIVTETERIDFADVVAIAKRSWQAPDHPCGAGQPVGCSIPEVVLALSDDYERQAEKFTAACKVHDFCYRHGYATYGESRESCDDRFYADMKDACRPMGALSLLDPKEFSICQAAALQTFEAVRRYGEPHFRTATSSVCVYR